MTDEFYEINKDIFENKEFNKLKNYKHHGITRYDHCFNVSYLTYKMRNMISSRFSTAYSAECAHSISQFSA